MTTPLVNIFGLVLMAAARGACISGTSSSSRRIAMSHDNPTPFWQTSNGLAAIALIIAVLYFLLTEHLAHTIAFLPYGILLLCPLIYIFMNRTFKMATLGLISASFLLTTATAGDLTPKHLDGADHGYPCVAAPLSPDPVGEFSEMYFGDLGFTMQAWRYPCDGDRSVPMFTVIPDDGESPLFCPNEGLMVQGMQQQANRYHMVQDPANPEPFCSAVVVPTTLAMVGSGMGGHRLNLDQPFTFMFDPDQQHGMDLFGYQADDYGVDSMGHAIGRHSGLTGVWYDPVTAGQGFSIQMTPGGVVVFYFGYDASGSRLWLISSLEAPPLAYADSITLTMYRGIGGVFGQPLPDIDAWGELVLIFEGCGEGSAMLDGQDGVIEMALTKLAGIDGLDCF